ncbi:MAG TPA: PEP-CTERM sorting domain-containing protein [Phycisphaerae bacterium]|nr:PEP-CTERM sorting domain-containing protein [Phycisphaerae bacterium]
MFLRFGTVSWVAVVCSAGIARVALADGTFAGAVVEYVPGAISSSALQQSAAATLGLPASVDDGQTSPFTPPFHASSISIVGAGGHLTLQFAAPVLPVSGPDIGVFTNTGLVSKTVNGAITASTAANGNAATFSTDAAIVSVSEFNNGDWVALNGGNPIDLTMPSNAFTDATISGSGVVTVSGGTIGANPYQPFTGTLKDFAGLTYPEMVTLLNGSFGGAWIDASGSGLAAINFIRFDVPTGDRLVLDGVTSAAAVPEPGTMSVFGIGAAGLLCGRRRNVRKSVSPFLWKGEFMKSRVLVVAGAVLLVGAAGRSAMAQSFVMNGTTYQVEDVAGSGPDKSLLELDFGSNALPQPHLFGYEWDPAVTPAPSERDVLVSLQNDNMGLTFTETYFASFSSYLLNTLWYKQNQPADDYPNSFWLLFDSADGKTWTDGQVGYDQASVVNGGFAGWAWQASDPNYGRDFNLPPLDPSHFPAAIGAPEPASLGLVIAAAGMLSARRRRRW